MSKTPQKLPPVLDITASPISLRGTVRPLDLSSSLSLFPSHRPHIRFSSNTLTPSLLVEHGVIRAMTNPYAFDKKTLISG